ncbi:MAG: hypothetical protein ABDH31_02295 [Chlorobiota bacterium]
MRRPFSIALLSCLLLLDGIGQYRRVHVHEIMELPPDSIAVGSLLSPFLGDTVLLVGIVTVPPVLDPASDRRPLLWAGARWVSFLRDSNPQLRAYAGINILQTDTTVQTTYFDRIRPGDYVEVLVRITNFPTSSDPIRNRLGPTQAEVITTRPVEFLDFGVPLPDPVPVQISDFYTGPVGNATPNISQGSRYVGMLVELRDVTVVANQPIIVVADAEGNQMYMRDQSGYFTTRGHRLRNFTPYPIGQRIRRLRGYITASTVGGQPQSFMITPVYPEDVELGTTPPVITSVARDPARPFPRSTDSVPITIGLRQGDFPLAYVHLKVDVGGQTRTISAARRSDTMFVATIPPYPPETLVRYWVEAADTAGTQVRMPLRGEYFYTVLDRAPRIADVRRTLNPDGSSGYIGFRVTVEGVITADTSDIPNNAAPRMYLQDDTTAFSGIWLHTTATTDPIRSFRRGDRIRVSGIVTELGARAQDRHVTALTALALVDQNGDGGFISSGNTIPPVLISTRSIAGKRQGEMPAEGWESMLVELRNVIVTDTNADAPSNFGEFFVVDAELFGTPQEATARLRVETDDGATRYGTRGTDGKTVLQRGQRLEYLRGILFYSFGNYKLVPRKDDDLGLVVNVPLPNSSALQHIGKGVVSQDGILEVALPSEGPAVVELYNWLGKRIWRWQGDVSSSTLRLSLSGLPSGTYVAVVVAGKHRAVSSVVLVH